MNPLYNIQKYVILKQLDVPNATQNYQNTCDRPFGDSCDIDSFQNVPLDKYLWQNVSFYLRYDESTLWNPKYVILKPFDVPNATPNYQNTCDYPFGDSCDIDSFRNVLLVNDLWQNMSFYLRYDECTLWNPKCVILKQLDVPNDTQNFRIRATTPLVNPVISISSETDH